MTHRASTGGRLFWLGLGLSLAVHLTFGFYLFTRYEHTPGAVDVPTDAISVNLETTDILNAREESPAVEAAGANPPGETGEVTPPDKVEPTPEEPRQPPQDEPVKAEKPPEEPAKADPAEAEKKEAEKQEAERVEQQRFAEEALRRAMDAEREKREAEQREREAQHRAEEQRQREAEQREAERREEERERQAEAREKAEKQRREQRKATRANGGATGSQGARASSGRVSASQGEIRNYGAIVRARIARNRPAAKGAKGNARIAIALSASGGLISARIVTSSGNAELDRSALAAVHRSSPFPPPPKGATRDQLSFTILFQFH